MASKLKQAAAERLMRQAAGDFGVLPMNASKYQAIQPDAAAYNVYSPAYAGALGKDTGTPAANILNTRALGVESERESQAYMLALQAAQDNQEKLQRQAGYINASDKVLEHDLDPGVNPTIGNVTVGQDQSGNYIINRDPAATAVINSENLNSQVAERVQKVGAGVKDLGAAGYILNPADVGGYITPAGQPTPIAPQENFTPVKLDNGQVVQMLPDEINDYITALNDGRKADAAMIAAKAAQLRAEKGTTAGKTVVTYDPEGHIASTTVTQPGSDPPEYAPNPKADVHSGGTSAKPSAASLPAIDLAPIKQIGAQFGTVTSTVRSKEHNKEVGGVKNSFHRDYGHGGHAIDIARKKGTTHAEIKAAYQHAGYTLVESKDEGDHSHFAFASGPAQAHASGAIPQQRRPVPNGLQRVVQLAQAKGYPTQVVGNGIRVTFPNGVSRLYNDQGKIQ